MLDKSKLTSFLDYSRKGKDGIYVKFEFFRKGLHNDHRTLLLNLEFWSPKKRSAEFELLKLFVDIGKLTFEKKSTKEYLNGIEKYY